MNPSIQSLSPSVPPIETSPHERWVSDSGVVYYKKCDNPVGPQEDPESYADIDKNLRVITLFLSKHGIQAIPYQGGKDSSKSELRADFNKLKKEEGIIRRKGLVVRCASTGEESVFTDKTYRMPWGKFDEYFERISVEQKTGKLAIFVSVKQGDVCKTLKDSNYESASAKIAYQKRVKDFEFFSLTFDLGEDSVSELRRVITYLAIAMGMAAKKENTDVVI